MGRVLLLYLLYQLSEQVHLELLKVQLVLFGVSDTGAWEAALVLDAKLSAAFLESVLDLLLHVEDLLFHARVPVILDCVIGSTLQILSNDGPLILVEPVLDVQNELLLERPVTLLDAWI